MAKSIKLTESQLKRLMKTTLNEQHNIKPTLNKGLKLMDMANQPSDK